MSRKAEEALLAAARAVLEDLERTRHHEVMGDWSYADTGEFDNSYPLLREAVNTYGHAP